MISAPVAQARLPACPRRPCLLCPVASYKSLCHIDHLRFILPPSRPDWDPLCSALIIVSTLDFMLHTIHYDNEGSTTLSPQFRILASGYAYSPHGRLK